MMKLYGLGNFQLKVLWDGQNNQTPTGLTQEGYAKKAGKASERRQATPKDSIFYKNPVGQMADF